MGKGAGSGGGAPRIDQDKTVELTRSKITRLADLEQKAHRPCLLVIAGPAMGRIFRLEKDVTVVGRSGEADVVIVDDGISRRHARIEQRSDGHAVTDLGSTNGVF